MYQNPTRDKNYIDALKQCILDQYGINATTITEAKRGYYGETWKLETQDQSFFIKIDYLSRHQDKLKNSLPVINYLTKQGIPFINKVILTLNQELYIHFNGAILAVFQWIEGKNVETDETKASEYQMLSEVYAMKLPKFNIPTLQFSDLEAITFFKQYQNLKENPKHASDFKVLAILEKHLEYLIHCANRLKEVANICQQDTHDFYLTHGDAGGNHIVGKDRNYILDWDEVMYAPLERDAWVMCCKDFARDLFNQTLHQKHIAYKLKKERLAFFCYHMFFFYLNEFMYDQHAFDLSQRVKDYFEDCWITERIKYADTLIIEKEANH